MNAKLFILVVIAANLVNGQIAVRRAAVARGGLVGGARVVGGLGVARVAAAPAIGVAGLGLGYGGYGLGYGGLGYAGLGYGGLGYGGLGYGLSHLGLAHGYGAYGLGLGRVAGLGLGLGLRAGAVGVSQHIGPVSAAIETIRSHQVVDVPTSQDVITPTNLIVEPNVLPVNIEFRSQSSPVNVNQVHIPGRPGEVQHTNSEEEPDRLIHEVVKPVIQEVRETVVPFRRITQEVLPVQEEVHSLVARGERHQVLAAPQVVGANVGAIGVAAPAAIGVAAPAGIALRRVAAVAAPTGIAVARGVGVGGVVAGGPVIAGGVVPAGGLVHTGIARFGGALGGLVAAPAGIAIRARS